MTLMIKLEITSSCQMEASFMKELKLTLGSSSWVEMYKERYSKKELVKAGKLEK